MNREQRRNNLKNIKGKDGQQVDLTFPRQLVEFARMIYLQKSARPTPMIVPKDYVEKNVKESFKEALAFENYSHHYLQKNTDKQLEKIKNGEETNPSEVEGVEDQEQTQPEGAT